MHVTVQGLQRFEVPNQYCVESHQG